MTAINRLRWLSALILTYYMQQIRNWGTVYYVVYDDRGIPIYIYVRWGFYRAAFPWVIKAALPPNLSIVSIEEICEPDERFKYFCVGLALNAD